MPHSNKILFIIPPYLPFDEYAPSKVGQKLPTLTPPYGVLSIISYINQNKEYDIEILDLNYEIINNKLIVDECEDILQKIISVKLRTFNPKYVCISALFNTSFPHMKYICPLIKNTLSKSILIVGGGLATNLYKDVFNEIPEIDLLCYGEGELPFKKLLEQLPQGKQPHEISPAWISDKSLQMQIKPEYDFIYNLDEIPIIDFNYIDLKKYNGRSYIDKDSDNIEVSIHTSRGCPYNCIYCSNYMVHGKKIRTMSNEKFLETVQFYINNYNMNTLLIEDDHFLADKKRALFLLEEIRKLNINIEFPNGIAVFKIDDEIAEALAKTKVKVLPLAIESGSDYILHAIINKPLKKEQIYKAIKCLKKYDIRLHAFIVIGFPDEFNRHREETLNLLIETGIDWSHIFIVVPIAGSRLYKQCEEKDYLLSKDYNDYTISKCNLKFSGELSSKELEEYSQYMNLKVNFLENSNFRNKKYDICKQYFQNVVNHYPSQAIAHYMLYKIYHEEKKINLKEHHYNIFKELLMTNDFYKNMINKFKKEGYTFDRL